MRFAPAAEFDWIRARLADPFSGAAAFVPGGFEAYVRLFHPADSHHGGEPSRSWAEIARRNGRVMHAGAQFHAIATPAGRPVADALNERNGPPPSRYGPAWGNLPDVEFGTLVDLLRPFTTTGQDTVCALWEGYGGVPDPPDRQRARLPIRRYLMLRGDLGSSGAGWWTWAEANGQWPQTPNLFWPADRAWCVGTEVDFDWTLIGGSAAAAEAILSAPRFEAWPVDPDTSMLITGDSLNR